MPIVIPSFLDYLLTAFLAEIQARGFLFATDSPSSSGLDIGEAVQSALSALSRRDSSIPFAAETPTSRATRGRILVLLPSTTPIVVYAICYSYTAVPNSDALDAMQFASWTLKLTDVGDGDRPHGPESVDGSAGDARSLTWAMKCITEALDRLAAKHNVQPSVAERAMKEVNDNFAAAISLFTSKKKEGKA